MILKLAAVFWWMVILPGGIGCLFQGDEADGNVFRSYIYGILTVLGCFSILAVPMCVASLSLYLLVGIWGVLVHVLFILSLIRNRTFCLQRRWLIAAAKCINIFMLAAAIIILLQMVYVTGNQHIDDDDAYFVAQAETIETRGMLYDANPYTGKTGGHQQNYRYVLFPWPAFTAVMSKVTGFQPVVFAHMILPLLVIAWAYIVYALTGSLLFPGSAEKQGIFLLLIAVILSFSGFSVYSAGTFLMIRSWQGKAVAAGFGIPALWYLCLRFQGKKDALLLALGCAAVCLMSGAGLIASGVLIAVRILAALFLEKDLRRACWLSPSLLPELTLGAVYVLKGVIR